MLHVSILPAGTAVVVVLEDMASGTPVLATAAGMVGLGRRRAAQSGRTVGEIIEDGL